MKLIFGLGNPGKKYEKTRHNVGFMVVDSMDNGQWTRDKRANCQFSIVNSQLFLIKPETFMNESGKSAALLVRRYEVEPQKFLVVHDDLDIPLGFYKLQFGKGPRQHNGVLSVENELGTKDFWRLRVGIDSRSAVSGQGSAVRGEDYVLQNFTEAERTVIDGLTKEKIVPEIQNWLLKN